MPGSGPKPLDQGPGIPQSSLLLLQRSQFPRALLGMAKLRVRGFSKATALFAEAALLRFTLHSLFLNLYVQTDRQIDRQADRLIDRFRHENAPAL